MPDFSLLKTPNYLELYQKSYDVSRDRARDEHVQNALSSAGKDLAGAEQELIGLGAFTEADQLRKIRVNQARQRAARAAQTLQYDEAAAALAEVGDEQGAAAYGQQGRQAKLGSMVAGGDLEGARTEALTGGDFDAAEAIGKMDDQQKAQLEERTQTLGAIAERLRSSVPEAQRADALRSLAPALAQRGFSQEELSALLSADLNDANLDAFIASASTLKDELARTKPVNVGEGGILFDPVTRKPIFENKKNFAPPRPASGSTAGGGSSPALIAIEAELRRRGALK